MTDLRTHPAVVAWRELRAGPLEFDRVETLRAAGKSRVYRLVARGDRPPAMIAKRRRARVLSRERAVYEMLRASLPVPALRCHGYVEQDDADGAFGWLFLDDAGGEPYSIDRPEHRELAGRWLARLHAATARAAGAAAWPERGAPHYRELLRAARDAIRKRASAGVEDEADRALLDGLASELDLVDAGWRHLEAPGADAPRALVHGDLAVKNVRVRRGDQGLELMVFDWEMAGYGVPAVDLAQFTGRSVSPDLPAYWSVAKERWPGLALEHVRRLAEIGTVFRLLAAIEWETASLFEDPVDFANVRLFRPKLEAAWRRLERWR